MTPEQRAAFVAARAAQLQCEAMALMAENMSAISQGNAVPYGERAFRELADRYSDVTHNAMIDFFHSL